MFDGDVGVVENREIFYVWTKSLQAWNFEEQNKFSSSLASYF